MSSTLSNSLQVAIIGYGLAGAVFHAPLVAATPGMTVAAISPTTRSASSRRSATFPTQPSLPQQRNSGATRRDMICRLW